MSLLNHFLNHFDRLARLSRLALSIPLCLFLLWMTGGWQSPSYLYAQGEPGIVRGQVSNGTPDGAVPVGLSVTLRLFTEGEQETRTATLADDGTFQFEDIPLSVDSALVAHVAYQGVEYASDLVVLEDEEQTALSLPITIYETTEDPSAVQITQMHEFISLAGDRLQIGEYYMIGNTGDRTYVGQILETHEERPRITLSFSLPDGATDLFFDETGGSGLGERYVETADGFADTQPIPPGSADVEVLFRYSLSYQEGMSVERVFDAPVASVALLLSEEGLALEGEGVEAAGQLDTQMGPTFSYSAGPLAAGEPLVFSLIARSESMPPLSPTPSGAMGASPARNTALETSLGLVALAVAVAAAYFLWRAPVSQPIPAQARPILNGIVALDADFEAGRVSERAYRRKRAGLEKQLHPFLDR